jgi:hypothetical protein
VDVDTGRSRWTRTLPGVQRLIGLSEDRLLVETSDGFLALNADSGEPIWRRDAGPRLEGRFLGGPGGLCYVRQNAGERDDVVPRPELVWVDAKTGAETASFVLHDVKRADLRFGPMIAHKDRLWTFVGAGPHDPNRDLVGLAPQGEAARALEFAADAWLPHISPSLRTAAERVLPDWRPFRGIAEKQAGHHPQMHGERDVFSLDGSRNQPVVFARRIAIPPAGRAKLRLRLAMENLILSQLQVEFNGKPAWEQKLDEQTLGAKQWRDFEADLSAHSGQTGWLFVRLIPEKDERLTSYWKRLEVAF